MENNNHYNSATLREVYQYSLFIRSTCEKEGGTKIMNISIVQHKRNVRVLVQKKAPNLLTIRNTFFYIEGLLYDTLTITLNSKTIAM